MGNQTSKNERAEADRLCAYWSPTEKEVLETRFQQFANAPEGFSNAIAKFIPSTFNKDLANAFATYTLLARNDSKAEKSPQNITFYAYLKAASDIMRNNEAAYTLYAVASEELQCTLEQFVSWIVKSAIPWWFIGSNLCKADDDNVWMDPEQEEGAARLTKYLLYQAEEKRQAQEKRDQADFAFWLDEQSGVDNGNKEIDSKALSWQKVVTSTAKVEKNVFDEWIQHTPDVLLLLRLAAKVFYFGTKIFTEEHDAHSARIAGYECPAITVPEEMKGQLREGRLSRLLTAYDYFFLVRSLPPNAVSWSASEQAKRRQTENLTHRPLFSSRRDGTSWQVFVNRILNEGATILIIKTKDGSIFGGFADEPWLPVTDWYGNSSNFLFRLGSGKYAGSLITNVWGGSNSANDHYQYLCWGKKSLPNGKIV